MRFIEDWHSKVSKMSRGNKYKSDKPCRHPLCLEKQPIRYVVRDRCYHCQRRRDAGSAARANGVATDITKRRAIEGHQSRRSSRCEYDFD